MHKFESINYQIFFNRSRLCIIIIFFNHQRSFEFAFLFLSSIHFISGKCHFWACAGHRGSQVTCQVKGRSVTHTLDPIKPHMKANSGLGRRFTQSRFLSTVSPGFKYTGILFYLILLYVFLVSIYGISFIYIWFVYLITPLCLSLKYVLYDYFVYKLFLLSILLFLFYVAVF